MKGLAIFLCALICCSSSYTFTKSDSVDLTVVMYHSILNSKTGDYVVSEKILENDLVAYKKEGYIFVFPSEVIAFAEGKGLLPEKPMMITFDDGHYNNLIYALPLLIKHQAKACLSPIGKFCQHSSVSGDDSNLNYSYLTWSQIGVLQKSGLFEIGNHTYNMHNYSPRFGISQKNGESIDEYKINLAKDVTLLNEKIYQTTKKTPVVFAYPFGKYNTTAKEVLLSLGFKLMMTCNEGLTTVTKGKPESIHYVRRYNRSGKLSTDEFINKIKKAQ